jgi:hypothetical protein
MYRRLSWICSLLLGCDAVEPAAVPSPRLNDVSVLTADQLRAVGTDDVVVAGDTPLRPGDIVVSETGAGLLRRVVAVVERAGERRVETTPAYLGDVVEDGELHLQLALYDGEELPQPRALSGPTLEGAAWAIGDTKITADAGLDIRVKQGSFYFDPALFLDFAVQGHKFEQFAIGAYGDLGAELEIEIKSDAMAKVSNKLWKIAQTPTFKFVGAIGPVPVVVTTRLELNLGASFTGKGAVHATQRVAIDGWVDLAASYDDGAWSTFGDHGFSLLKVSPIVTATGEAVGKVYLEGKLSFAFYDVIGPTFALRPYGEIGVKSGNSPSWNTSAGVTGRLGGEVKLTDYHKIGVEATLFDWKQPLASGKLGGVTCQSQAGAAPWLGGQKCNVAAVKASFGALHSCIQGGGGKSCLTDPARYPSVLCGPGSGGGYTCQLDDLFACICNGGGQACLAAAKTLCSL